MRSDYFGMDRVRDGLKSVAIGPLANRRPSPRDASYNLAWSTKVDAERNALQRRTEVRRVNAALLFLAVLLAPISSRAADDYQLGPDSQKQDVPHGEVTHYNWTSKIFPGTQRDYWVYIPKQYDAAKPACVMIFQDGGGFQDSNGQFRVPVVFDNLIAKKEMPVTVAIMINPGVAPAPNNNALPRFNRSVEYDAPTDLYARFLMEEILPEVGKKVNLTKDPTGRALCGASSGGIASFVAAWERPDQFSKVVSFIGSFTNLRGGHIYGSLIRKMEPKPIRVYMQDGSNDQDIYSGAWFIGNNDVAAALRFGGYDMQFVTGDGGHSGRQGGAILPEALRWLWRDYPAPIKSAAMTRQPVMEILQAGEDWQLVSGEFKTPYGLAADTSGNVYVSDPGTDRITKINGEGQTSVFKEDAGGATALACGPEGKLYASLPKKGQIVAFDAAGKSSVIANGVSAGGLVVNHQGQMYFTDLRTATVCLLDSKRKKTAQATGIEAPYGLTLTPDQSLLLVTQATPESSVVSCGIAPGGSLVNPQSYFDLHVPWGEGLSGANGMATDTKGWLYVASKAGLQMCDQAGRVNGIIANPSRSPSGQVVFGGTNLDTLYTTAGGKLYRRKTRAKGVVPAQEPIKPPGPRL